MRSFQPPSPHTPKIENKKFTCRLTQEAADWLQNYELGELIERLARDEWLMFRPDQMLELITTANTLKNSLLEPETVPPKKK